MKKILLVVAIATITLSLCANMTYANLNDISCASDISNEISLNSSCASSCYAVNSGNDCGNIVYEIDDFPGSAHHSTLGGNGSGTGCQYYGYTSPYTLGAGSGSSYTLCTEYTASSIEASYVTYINVGSSSCIDRSISLYKANTCSAPAGVNVEQPTASSPGRARGLAIGESYVVCHSYTENGCSSDFASNIFEVCMIISEAAYCSSSVNPQPVETCSGEDFQVILDNNCTVDPDLGVTGGIPGYAALFYSTDGGDTYINFPENSVAEDINGNINYKFYDDSNFDNGGGCSPIDVQSIVNTGCEPLVIPVGIVSVNVSSVGTPILRILPDCPIIETTVTVYPQLTSQVTNNTIQLIAEDGTVCETYTNSGSGSGSNNQGDIDSDSSTVPINPNAYTPRSVIYSQNSISGFVLFQGSSFGTVNGGTGGLNQNGGFDSENPPSQGGGIPDDVMCVTPAGSNGKISNNNGETLLDHTVDLNDEGQLVFNYNLPAQKAKLYPNPATNQLFFATGTSDAYTVRIYDTLGKQVLVGQTNDDIAVDIQHLSSGLYTYALEDNQQNVFSHGKWVKQ